LGAPRRRLEDLMLDDSVARFMIDCEFIAPGRGHPIYPLSIAVVADPPEGHVADIPRELYLTIADAPFAQADAFVRDNVIPNLNLAGDGYDLSRVDGPGRGVLAVDVRWGEAGSEILEFVSAWRFEVKDRRPAFYGYYCDFDYVVLSQAMGGLDGWPEHWPMWMRDLKQYVQMIGDPPIPDFAAEGHRQDLHNALADARWIRRAYHWLVAETHAGLYAVGDRL
jgi:hypothetical protein